MPGKRDQGNVLGYPVGRYGHRLVGGPVVCVLTRVHLRSVRALPSMWRLFRQVRGQARQIPELLRAEFLLAGPRTFFILSLWSSEEGLLRFGTVVGSHLTAVRQTFRHAARVGSAPEIWSTQWRAWSASNNLRWDASLNWQDLLPTARAATAAEGDGDPPGQPKPGGH